jgi:hypothetical protein
MDIGRERFRWLLVQRGMPFVDEDGLETEITVERTKPDFLVSPPGFPRFLVEVEGFEEPGPLAFRTARTYAGSGDESLPRLRTAVRHGAIQLKPYRDLAFDTCRFGQHPASGTIASSRGLMESLWR